MSSDDLHPGPRPDDDERASFEDDPVLAAFRRDFAGAIDGLRTAEDGAIDGRRRRALAARLAKEVDRDALEFAPGAGPSALPARWFGGAARARAFAAAAAAVLLLACLVVFGPRGATTPSAPGESRALAPRSFDDADTLGARDRNGDGRIDVIDAYLAARALDEAIRAGDADALTRRAMREREIRGILDEAVRVDARRRAGEAPDGGRS